MAGTSYTRQSTMSDGDTITAALFNNEFNQILNAFAYASSSTTGHQHDGGAGEGGNIEIIGDQDFLNKIVVDGTNNRWGFFVEVSSSAVEQIRIQDGAIVPVTDNDIDLGTSSLEFKDAYFDGTVTTDALVADTADINGGTVDGATIGASSATTIVGTTITANTAFVPDASDGAALGTTSLEFSDLYLADGAVVYFGDDQDVSLTHVADTGLLLSSTDQLQFGDSGTYIYQSADGVLDLVSDTEIELNATTIDINGAVDVSGEIAAASLDISGNVDIDGTTNLDAVDIDGAVQIDGATTYGVDDTGVDVKMFGATSGAYLLWDESADKLLTAGGAVVDIVKDKLLIGGTAVTTTAAELNVLDAVTAGTVTASLGVVVDSNKDIGTFRNITLSGELDAGSLDISGDADIDGTLEADAITVDGTALATYIRDTVGTNMLSSNTESGITVTYDTSNDNIDFAVDAAQTGITSLLATDIKIGEDDQTKIDFETADEIHFYAANVEQVYLGDNIFGPQSDSDVDLGSSSVRWKDAYVDSITVTGEVDGASLDISGDADIDGTLEADAITVDGTALNEYIADTVGAMVSSNTETNITVTYEDGDNTLDFAVGTLNQDTTGNAATFTATANNTADETVYPVFVDGATGSQGAETDTGFTYNPSSGLLTISGELDAGSLDISGDADIDGTLEADAITVDGTTLAEYIADTAGAMVSSNTETGITVTYQDADNTIDFALAAAQTTITSLLATDIKIGEDDETKIDFEDANEINFYADNEKKAELTSTGLKLIGTTPTLTIGDAGAEDTKIIFDGNAQDFYVGLDDSADDLLIGVGSTVGTTPAISIDENQDVVANQEFRAVSYNDTYVAPTSSSNATTIACESGNYFKHTLTENTTFTFSNPPASGTGFSFILHLIQDSSARTVTWPGAVDWAGGTAPTISTSSGADDFFVFATSDGGTIWYGFTAGQDLK
jgi:cytoskeletal protein CcmA (bactofilin family)